MQCLSPEQIAEANNGTYNFDHPSAFDYDLMCEVLNQIREGAPTEVPTYDFCTHSRGTDVIKVPIVDVIILEGILIFHEKN